LQMAHLVNYGANQSTQSANTGYHIDSVIVDGGARGGWLHITNVTAARRSVQSLRSMRLHRSSDAGANGAIGPSGSVKRAGGRKPTLRRSPHHVDFGSSLTG
jgi:hypothetical protein